MARMGSGGVLGQKLEDEQLEVFQGTLRTLAETVPVGGEQRQCGSPEGL